LLLHCNHPARWAPLRGGELDWTWTENIKKQREARPFRGLGGSAEINRI
jgi:hypothetical protein